MSRENTSPPSLSRRIVTGVDPESGKAKVLQDDTVGHIHTLPSGSIFQTVWFTDEVPVDCSPNTNEDPSGNKTFQISNNGTVGTFVSMAPGGRAPMHKTKSIDYGILLEGELELELDSGEKRLMKPGDVVVQRETMHAWYNPSPTKWTKMFFVLVASTNVREDE
ncbi:cupin domain protein [Hysterangium stoloniferum]|nr:cupin domain protein [Hysterangium stoloniferum]